MTCFADVGDEWTDSVSQQPKQAKVTLQLGHAVCILYRIVLKGVLPHVPPDATSSCHFYSRHVDVFFMYAQSVPADAGKLTLREGVEAPLAFTEPLSSKTATEGDPIVLVLTDDIKVGDIVVARAGCKAFGEITNAKKSGMMGKAGELSVRLNYLKVGDQKVKLRGTKAKEGEAKLAQRSR